MQGEKLKDKHVVILGLARQGTALARFLAGAGAEVTVSDLQAEDALVDQRQELTDVPIRYVLGGHPISLLDDADVLCLSGGVPLDILIAEEALENAARHASATRVEIRLAFAPGSVTLTVEDDGVGLGDSDRAEGLGMLGMAERAELVGGRCTVERVDKRGTRVQVTLPRREV